MNNKYLPIGTVCLLKGGKKRVMISGFCATPKEDQSKTYDYSGCIFPEGFIVSNQVCLFNHDQIEKIYYMGYEDESHKAFSNVLLKLVNKPKDKSIFEDKIIEI